MKKARKGALPARIDAVPSDGPERAQKSWEGKVGPGGAARADLYIAETAGVLSRSQIKARGAVIRVNGREAKPSRPLKPGDILEVLWTEEEADSFEAEDIPLAILYEDPRVLVVDKAQGMVTHPGAGNRSGTLANAALHIAQRWRASPAVTAPGEAPRPAMRAGIVHRLDKDTSGVIIVAKDLEAQVHLAGQFKERLVRKEYLAITLGIPAPLLGRIADSLGRDKRDRKRFAAVPEGGKAAVTDYRVLSAWGVAIDGGAGYALVSLRPRTGRTHQLRVHMAGLGTPILGDPIYGRKDRLFPEASLMLHAYRLKISLPGGEGASLFMAPLPARFKDILGGLSAAFGAGRPSAVPGGQPKHVPR
jgi:23S rRNA pseudouridine1911/1915/1917 synthase